MKLEKGPGQRKRILNERKGNDRTYVTRATWVGEEKQRKGRGEGSGRQGDQRKHSIHGNAMMKPMTLYANLKNNKYQCHIYYLPTKVTSILPSMGSER